MKPGRYALLLLPVLIGCSSVKPQKMVTSCGNHSRQEIMTTISSLLIGEKMKITNINDYVGLIEASRQIDETNLATWQFIVRPGSIDAYARITNGNSAPVDLGDDPPSHNRWYWNVRDGVEQLCGEEARFITLKQ